MREAGDIVWKRRSGEADDGARMLGKVESADSKDATAEFWPY